MQDQIKGSEFKLFKMGGDVEKSLAADQVQIPGYDSIGKAMKSIGKAMKKTLLAVSILLIAGVIDSQAITHMGGGYNMMYGNQTGYGSSTR